MATRLLSPVSGSPETHTLIVLMFNRMVAFAFNGMLGPLLVAIAASYRMPVSDAAWLAAATALGWAMAATKTPRYIGRYGAKRVMLLGLTGVAVTLLATPVLTPLPAILVARFLGGVGGGAMGPASNVYLIEIFSVERRSRAFGWVSTGFGLGGALLVPLLTYGSRFWGWRGSFVAEGLLILGAVVLSYAIFPPGHRGSPDSGAKNSKARLSDSPLAFLGANFAERSGNALMMTFWPALLIVRYDWNLSLVAVATGVMYLGAALGSTLGGTLLSRYHWRERSVYIVGVGIAGLILGVIFGWIRLPAWAYVAGGCLYAISDNCARPAYFQLVSRARKSYRNTMGWNAISNQLGGVTGNMALPLLVAASGYALLGWVGLAISGVALGLVTWGT